MGDGAFAFGFLFPFLFSVVFFSWDIQQVALGLEIWMRGFLFFSFRCLAWDVCNGWDI